jgi:hypothetical protein
VSVADVDNPDLLSFDPVVDVVRILRNEELIGAALLGFRRKHREVGEQRNGWTIARLTLIAPCGLRWLR